MYWFVRGEEVGCTVRSGAEFQTRAHGPGWSNKTKLDVTVLNLSRCPA
jgi:hypothetical protein